MTQITDSAMPLAEKCPSTPPHQQIADNPFSGVQWSWIFYKFPAFPRDDVWRDPGGSSWFINGGFSKYTVP